MLEKNQIELKAREFPRSDTEKGENTRKGEARDQPSQEERGKK